MAEPTNTTRPSCTPEAKRAYNIAYRLKHKEKLDAAKKEWWAKNGKDPERKERRRLRHAELKEERNAYSRANYQKNKEKMKADAKANYYANKENSSEKMKLWRAANAESLKAKKQAYYRISHTKRMKPRPHAKCKQCGKDFKTRHDAEIYCSGKCSGLSKRKFPDYDCLVCGKTFVQSHKHRKCCSQFCKDEAKRQSLQVGTRFCAYCNSPFPVVFGKAGKKFCHKTCVSRASDFLYSHAKRITGAATLKQWQDRLRYFDYRCAYCHKKLGIPFVEHMVPLSRGGTGGISNLVPSCLSCNSSKRNRNIIEWLLFLQNKRKKKRL